ncbi:acyl-CoA dehydrogenase family protein [Streptomyces coelicoflavus]|uniref:acyl-CoA dehydrogenase family protein n=1 Tax=Streptomyces coelicoflavus TaxID=285562 RepID=UPI0024AE5126|nr:acyl-CoA dehydrogenase family protein [Streptomyces coelicoflavus]MDI6520324.1 acyl-CoA dehydrogenase family protein [Streptomyces coelicoflavus]
MNRPGSEPDPDRRALLEMLDAFVADRDQDLTDDADRVGSLRREVAALGVWTLGVAEQYGGGGADRATTTAAVERLARRWPALALASVHAHAAADALGPVGGDLLSRVHTGDAVVAVVDTETNQVELTRDGDTVAGSVERVDVTGAPEALIVLTPASGALLFDAQAMTAGPVLRRCGLGGAGTRGLTLSGTLGASVHELGADATAVRNRVRLGSAAVAAGIAAGAVAEAAAYAAGRHQFGAALTALPTVRASLFEQSARAAAALSAVLDADGRDRFAAAAALTGACDVAVDVAAASLQIHGGYGYLKEYPAERHLRDAVSLRAAVDAAGVAASEAGHLVGPP